VYARRVQVLYLPGFASGPGSTKAMAYAEHFAKRGIALERLDLRKPSFEHLRLSAMIDHVRATITGPAVLIGSSLGAVCAARVAERDDRVKAVVLLAPAFHFVERWQQQLGTEWDEWKRSGWREVYDFATGGTSKIDWGFMEDAKTIYAKRVELNIPGLIIHGTRDEVVPVSHSRTFAANKPNVTLLEIDDGHQLTDSIPRLIAETDRFLAPYIYSQ
jgi:pimeloyl-ACP methyl ester carboxylesterase